MLEKKSGAIPNSRLYNAAPEAETDESQPWVWSSITRIGLKKRQRPI